MVPLKTAASWVTTPHWRRTVWWSQLREVAAVEQDLPLGGRIEAEDEIDQGGLAAARGADEGSPGAGGDRQVDVPHRPAGGASMPQADVDQVDVPGERRRGPARPIGLLGRDSQHGAEPVQYALHALELLERGRQPRERLGEARGEGDEAEHRADGEPARQHLPGGDERQGEDGGPGDCAQRGGCDGGQAGLAGTGGELALVLGAPAAERPRFAGGDLDRADPAQGLGGNAARLTDFGQCGHGQPGDPAGRDDDEQDLHQPEPADHKRECREKTSRTTA